MPKILIVDDEPLLREVIVECVEAQGLFSDDAEHDRQGISDQRPPAKS